MPRRESQRAGVVWLAALLVSGAPMVGCTPLRPGTDRPVDSGVPPDAGDFDGGRCAVSGRGRVEINGIIQVDTTWTCDATYVLTGIVRVEGATLTIEPGVEIQGNPGARLIVAADAQLLAEGTEQLPIRFQGPLGASTRPGSWGGIMWLGRAPLADSGTVTLEVGPAASGLSYGGDAPTHSCGRMRYVTIDGAGARLLARDPQSDRLENALTLAGCGSETLVQDVRVSYAQDDSLVLLGGSAVVRRVYLERGDNEGVEFDIGYRGVIQQLVIRSHGDGNGIRGRASEPGARRATPVIANVTMIGADAVDALSFEDASGATVLNLVSEAYADDAIDLSWEAMLSPAPEVTNSVFFVQGPTRYFPRVGEGDDPLPGGGFFDEGSYYRDLSRGNCFGVDPAVDLTTYEIAGALGTTCIPTESQLVDDRLRPGNYLGALDPTGEDWLRWML